MQTAIALQQILQKVLIFNLAIEMTRARHFEANALKQSGK